MFRSLISRTIIGRIWSLIRSSQQEREFTKLLLSVPLGSYSCPPLEKELNRIAATRRRLSACPHVLALGHKAWEHYGLWPTFKRLSDFHIEIVNTTAGEPWGEVNRRRVGQNLMARIKQLEHKRPVELVFLYCDSSFVDPEAIKNLSSRGIWTILMGLDDKHKFCERREFGMRVGQSLIAPLVDLYWTTWKAGLPLFWKIGARPVYLAEGADPEYHKPIECLKDIDVLFLGQCYGNRPQLIGYLRQQGFDVQTYGKGWPNGHTTFEKSVELISRAKVVLGIGDVGYVQGIQHLKGRDFEVPMCGAVYLTSYNPELADWYDIGRDILCYSSPQNCGELLLWILNDPEEQEKIRHAALARSRREHTWEKRISELFKLIA